MVNCMDQYWGYYAQSLVFHKTVEAAPAREGKVSFSAEIYFLYFTTFQTRMCQSHEMAGKWIASTL